MRSILAIILSLILASVVAAAVVDPIRHTAFNVTTTSQTVTTGYNRLLVLVNDSDTTIYCNVAGGTAVANQGIRLNASGGSAFFDIAVPKGPVNCIHAGTGNKVLLVTEG